MATIQEIIHAKKWLKLAISKNKLADFVIGLPPYAKTVPDNAGNPQPVLVPNLLCLYSYCDAHPGFPKKVEQALFEKIEASGDQEAIVCYTLQFLILQLSKENSGTAGFTLDCTAMLCALRKKIEENPRQFSADTWSLIRFYDSHISKNYGLHLLTR